VVVLQWSSRPKLISLHFPHLVLVIEETSSSAFFICLPFFHGVKITFKRRENEIVFLNSL
jgi:hypothetical protein